VCRALSDFKTKFLKRLTLHNKNVSFAVEAEAEAFACILTFDADNEGRTTAPQKRGRERGMVCCGWWVVGGQDIAARTPTRVRMLRQFNGCYCHCHCHCLLPCVNVVSSMAP